MAKMTIVQAVNLALKNEMEKDDQVICLGEDIGVNGGVFRATDGLQSIFGEDRVVDTPIAEAAIIGASVGMAAKGIKPVAEIQFLGFIYEAMDQMAAQVARIRYRTAGSITAPLVVRAPYGGGVSAPELHSDSLEALFLHTPGLKVVMPSTPYDAKGLLTAAIRDPDPVLFLEPMKLYRSITEEVPEEDYEITIGEANRLREGTDLTIISWGPPVHLVTQVADKWNKEKGLSIEVIDLRTIVPMDINAIIESVEKTERVIIVHEAVKSGGVGAEISALISERALYSLAAPILRVTGFDTPYPVAGVEAEWLPNEKRLDEAIVKVMED